MGLIWRLVTGGLAVALVLPPGERSAAAQAGTSGLAGPVSLDFVVLGQDGTPVADLAAAQVTLRVDGRARPLQSLRYVAVGDRRAGTGGVAADPPFTTNVLTDEVQPGRVIVLVVEDESVEINRERPMREAVGLLLTSLAPRDRVAVVTVPHGGLRLDFTTDHTKAIRVFSEISGQAPRGETDADAACRTRDTLNALTGLLDDLAGGEGPTTVVFFSMGLVGPSEMVLPARGAPGAATPVIGRCTLLPEAFTQTGTAAGLARANFYIVRPDVAASPAGRLEGIENLAGVTGGTRLSLGGPAEVALGRVARESAGYFVATFMPEPSERDGLNHRVEVRVARPDVQVRSRSGVPIPKPRAAIAGAPSQARDLLRTGRVQRELPLRVAAFVSRDVGDAFRIVALAEPIEEGVVLTSASVGLLDAKGQLIAQWSATAADLAARPFHAGLVARGGRYRVRAAATDSSGRRGTADYELDGSLTPAGPLLLSSLVVGLSRDGRFVPRLEFGAEASAMAQLEIYGGAAGTPVGAMLEVSAETNGKPLFTAPLILEATNDRDRFIARGTIPIGALPSGDFVARAIVEQKGQPAGRVMRTIRKR